MVFQVRDLGEEYQVSGENEKNTPESPEGPSMEASSGVHEMSGFRTLDSLDDASFGPLQSWNQGSGSQTVCEP